jgi:hypothetical protein
MVDLNAHEAGNGGKKPREAYRLPSLLYSELARSSAPWKGVGLSGCKTRPQTGSLHPMAIEVDCF